MPENPYQPPQEVGTKDGAALRANWSLTRTAVVLVLIPVSIAIWYGGFLLLTWMVVATEFPPLKAIGADVVMAGIGTTAALPVLVLLAVVLRASRRLARVNEAV